eukprot:scaffold60789_cov45-Phaeocystis_antarctica.AAC.2
MRGRRRETRWQRRQHLVVAPPLRLSLRLGALRPGGGRSSTPRSGHAGWACRDAKHLVVAPRVRLRGPRPGGGRGGAPRSGHAGWRADWLARVAPARDGERQVEEWLGRRRDVAAAW